MDIMIETGTSVIRLVGVRLLGLGWCLYGLTSSALWSSSPMHPVSEIQSLDISALIWTLMHCALITALFSFQKTKEDTSSMPSPHFPLQVATNSMSTRTLLSIHPLLRCSANVAARSDPVSYQNSTGEWLKRPPTSTSF